MALGDRNCNRHPKHKANDCPHHGRPQEETCYCVASVKFQALHDPSGVSAMLVNDVPPSPFAQLTEMDRGALMRNRILDRAGLHPEPDAEEPQSPIGGTARELSLLARLVVVWLLAISIAAVNLAFKITQLMDWLNGGGAGCARYFTCRFIPGKHARACPLGDPAPWRLMDAQPRHYVSADTYDRLHVAYGLSSGPMESHVKFTIHRCMLGFNGETCGKDPCVVQDV